MQVRGLPRGRECERLRGGAYCVDEGVPLGDLSYGGGAKGKCGPGRILSASAFLQ